MCISCYHVYVYVFNQNLCMIYSDIIVATTFSRLSIALNFDSKLPQVLYIVSSRCYQRLDILFKIIFAFP